MSMGLSLGLGIGAQQSVLGFAASFAAQVAHDAVSGVVGTISTSNAEGPVTIVGGDFAGTAGSAGGLFSATGLTISFDRNTLGDAFLQGDSTLTTLAIQVTDTVTTLDVVLRVTVLRENTVPTAAGALGDLTLAIDTAMTPVDVSGDFTDTDDTLTYTATGLAAGMSISSVGVISGTPTAIVTTQSVVVTATDTAGQTAQSGFSLTTFDAAPANTVLPSITGTPEVGQVLTANDGTWTGDPSPTLTREWLRDGVAISGETGTTYTLVADDDLTDISLRVTGTNASGSAVATSAAVSVTFPAPVAADGLAPTFTQNTGVQTVDVSADFTNANGGSYSLDTTDTGVTINASTGVLSIDTDTTGLLSAEDIQVRYTNSGGFDVSNVSLTVNDVVVLTGPAVPGGANVYGVDAASTTETGSFATVTDATEVWAFVYNNGASRPESVTYDGNAMTLMGQVGCRARDASSREFRSITAYRIEVSGTTTANMVVTNRSGYDRAQFVLGVSYSNLNTRSWRMYGEFVFYDNAGFAQQTPSAGIDYEADDIVIAAYMGQIDPSITGPSFTSQATGNQSFTVFQGAVYTHLPTTTGTADTVTFTDNAFRSYSGLMVLVGTSDQRASILPSAIESGRILPTDGGATTHARTESGLFYNAPAAIEMQTVLFGTSTVVDAFATVDASPSGSTYSGTFTMSESEYVQRQYRYVGQSTVFTDPNPIAAGEVAACYGQSNMAFFHGRVDSPPQMARSTYWYQRANGFGIAPPGDGVRTYMNQFLTNAGVGIMAYEGAVAGTQITALDDIGTPTTNWDNFEPMVLEAGATCFAWLQGEADATGTGTAFATYQTSFDSIHAGVAAAAGRTAAQTPAYIIGVGREVGGSDAGYTSIRDTLQTLAGTQAYYHYSHSHVPFDLADSVHTTAADLANGGVMLAYTHSHVRGDTGFAADPHFTVTSVAIDSATQTTVTITHGAGADFTPTTAIDGFTVSNDDFATVDVTPSAAVRATATTITLTHSDIGTSARQVGYQRGADPTVTGAVVDDSAPAFPLAPIGSIAA